MSIDIDMQSYAGETESPVAAEQPVDNNSYQDQPDADVVVHQELLDSSPKEVTKNPEINPQAEHFKALREEVGRLKAEQERVRNEHEEQLSMLKANASPQRAEPSRPEPKMFEGMDESDVPNVREIRNAWEQRESQYQARIEELQVQQMHPDYAEVIEKYAVPLVKQKPHLAEGLYAARNKALFAYELGVMAKQAQQQQIPVQPQVSESAQRIVENARKPGTLSQAGGQGSLSKADYYATMSDSEFAKLASKFLDTI